MVEQVEKFPISKFRIICVGVTLHVLCGWLVHLLCFSYHFILSDVKVFCLHEV